MGGGGGREGPTDLSFTPPPEESILGGRWEDTFVNGYIKRLYRKGWVVILGIKHGLHNSLVFLLKLNFSCTYGDQNVSVSYLTI